MNYNMILTIVIVVYIGILAFLLSRLQTNQNTADTIWRPEGASGRYGIVVRFHFYQYHIVGFGGAAGVFGFSLLYIF